MGAPLRTIAAVFGVLGLVLLVLAGAMVLTGVCGWLWLDEALPTMARAFFLPSLALTVVGAPLAIWVHTGVLDEVQAMLVCGLAWVLASVVGAVPLQLLVGASWIDASFEMVSGFTTTGITVFTGLDAFPRSALLWRALSQWIGGVGILSLFVALVRSSALAHRLGGTEAHKIRAARPVPGPLRTLQLFSLIYLGITVLVALALAAGGVGVFDAITHAFTTVSTGGFSTHDASVAYWRDPAVVGVSPRYIEWVLLLGMAAGGTSFVVHFRLARGDLRALWDRAEIRAWIGWLVVVTAALLFTQWFRGTGTFAADALMSTHAAGSSSLARAEAALRTTGFTVVAIATTTGFATVDIAGPFFAATGKVLFLILMVVGGCVGSTSGGLKLTRVLLLIRMMWRELERLVLPHSAALPIVVDRGIVDDAELGRVVGLSVAWVCLLGTGTLLTTLLSGHDGWAAFSGVSSALNNIGPCYLSISEISALTPTVKLTWMAAMLAGRLEILPLFALLSWRAWAR